MKKIAITGGKSTGKSTLLHYIEDKGYSTLSYEEILDEIISSKNISKLGSKDIPSLKRKVELDLNTENPNAIKRLAIPLIFSSIKKKSLLAALTGKSSLFIEIPFLYECHLEKYFDKILVVTCGPKTQEERISLLYKSDTFPNKIADNQISLQEKRKSCDVVIDNNREPSDMFFQMDSILASEQKYSLFFFISFFSLIFSLFIPIFLWESSKNFLLLLPIRIKHFLILHFSSFLYKVLFSYYISKELLSKFLLTMHRMLMDVVSYNTPRRSTP
ncbi:dephospho-CoA kinase [Nematocida sp. LUAm3]|nr:dephospho-CoA kinase [Nematocida sp. LUAm3]KAI5173910.1 dephospho-CoA kinase [Nematocida sp. LUAm2]KAI5177345.1 dephospho-CoA kinase [Nematocida sp. LUAm1]